MTSFLKISNNVFTKNDVGYRKVKCLLSTPFEFVEMFFRSSPPTRSDILYEKNFQDFAFFENFFIEKSPRPSKEARALYIYIGKMSIKSKLCEHCTNFEKKGLTNGLKHDIIKISKVSLVCFDTERSTNYDLWLLSSEHQASTHNKTDY